VLILSRFRRPSSKGFRTFQDYPRTGTGFGDTLMMMPTGKVGIIRLREPMHGHPNGPSVFGLDRDRSGLFQRGQGPVLGVAANPELVQFAIR
jgi:hypothetical protein